MRRGFLSFMVAAVGVALLSLSFPLVASGYYKFDDVFGSGSSVRGGQWVVITGDNDSLGASLSGKFAEDMITAADFVNVRDSVYIYNNDPDGEPVKIIFMVVPEQDETLGIRFNQIATPPPVDTYTQDVLSLAEPPYTVVKAPLNSPATWWKFYFKKTSSASAYETVRGGMEFRQNPDKAPSQSTQVPLVIANVCNGPASDKPLIFRSALRENYSGGMYGDIVAYDRFEWDVTGDKEAGGGSSDWVFVPLNHSDRNNHPPINYRLVTDVTNYCGLRYGLQRYDDLTGYGWMYPSRWAMDLPAENTGDILPEIVLDPLSHMPPGMITTYNQNFNVVTGVKEIFHMYPIDYGSPFRNLTLSHPSIFGVDLGMESGTHYKVTGFQLLAADPEFEKEAAWACSSRRRLVMAEPDKGIMSGGVTGSGFIAGDAINTLNIDAPVAKGFFGASSSTTILPLHITFNMPKSDIIVAQKWNSLLAEWKRSGTIKSSFENEFSLYMAGGSGAGVFDLFKWLSGKGLFDRNVKVFLDEQKECITVSFIMMLVDGPDRKVGLARDRSVITDNSYIVIQDGIENNRMQLTLFTAPANYFSPDDGGNGNNDGPASSGSGGGGCSGAAAAPLAVLAAAAALILRNAGISKNLRRGCK